MTVKKLSTESYKGVRDFYPEDMAIERHIFDTWSNSAELFGFERYDASILEPSELYKAKGAENEEMVNEQTYTFTDRGNREVTLRPEMTPTVARMIAAKRRNLQFPVRWYSIPNCFRYERTQRGRLREFWQLNCDIFGGDPASADAEIIALAHQLLIDFGATPDMFEIRVNDRGLMERLYRAIGVPVHMFGPITALNDRRRKITDAMYRDSLTDITDSDTLTEQIILMLDHSDEQSDIMFSLAELGITNAVFDKSLARGFAYYTGTIFEVLDVSGENNRSMLGGGRYDNLTSMFGGEPISGVGFGMGDVTMRDFLETHNLLDDYVPTHAPTLLIIPTDNTQNLTSLKIASEFRHSSIRTVTDTSNKKIGEKISRAVARGIPYTIIVGEDEAGGGPLTLKHLTTNTETVGTIPDLRTTMAQA